MYRNRNPKLYYGTNYMYLEGYRFIFKFTGGGNPPLVNCVTKKKKKSLVGDEG